MGKRTIILASGLVAVAAVAGIIMGKFAKGKESEEKGFIGKSEIRVEDGKMTPEVLLAFGRLSDPQVSPDGKKLLYGVSYNSIEENRSCRNLYISNLDGSDAHLATRSGKSISNARWSADGKKVAYLMGGQIYIATVRKDGTLGKGKKASDIAAGIGEFKLSPDQSQVIFLSTVAGRVKTPGQIYPDLPKAEAYETETMMYRHWDHWVEEIPHSFVGTFN